MTDTEINIAIAAFHGATCRYRHTIIGPELVVFGGKDLFWDKYKVRSPEESVGTHNLPPYSSSLDAMHEVASKLSIADNEVFVDWIIEIATNESTRRTDGYYEAVNATSRQRAEALLRTIGKWKD